jgi:thymidylate synthase
MKTYETIHEAYLGTLEDVLDNPDCISAPRGQKVREKFNYMFKITKPTVEFITTKDPERNKTIASYSQKEFDLYNKNTFSVHDYGQISKFWLKLANPDDTVNSAYGPLVRHKKSMGNDFEQALVDHPAYDNESSPGSVKTYGAKRRTPMEWVILKLRQDKDTRQAVMKFSLPEHFWDGNKDFTCTLHAFFQIRDNKLDMTVNMRSNDLMLGLVFDLPWFISLMTEIKDQLTDLYPELEIGTYTHLVHNIHIYDRDVKKVYKMIGRD